MALCSELLVSPSGCSGAVLLHLAAVYVTIAVHEQLTTSLTEDEFVKGRHD
jgi:nitrogenase molybdenum-iron protein alpha/beta subunit